MAFFLGSGRVVPAITTHVINNQSKSGIIPSTQSQIIKPDAGYTGLSQVTIEAIPDTYVLPSGTYTVTNSGIYNISTYASVKVNSMSNPTWTTPSLNSSTAKLIYSATIYSGFNSTVQSFSSSYTLPTVSGSTIIPSDTSQIAVESYKWTTGSIIVDAIPSTITIYKKIYEKTINDNEINEFLTMINSISDYMFIGCNNFNSIINNNISYIGSSAFAFTSIHSASFSQVISMGTYTFTSCSIKEANFSNLEQIPSYAFFCCYSLISASFPNATTIQYGAFYGAKFSEAYYSKVVEMSFAFPYNYSMVSANFPELISMYNECFRNCSSLTDIFMPKLQYISGNGFISCSKLSIISLPNLSFISGNVFSGCIKLESVYFTNSIIINLTSSSIFYKTPITDSSYTGTFGSIYVPASLLTAYQTATNWSYFSSRFVGV